ncbi:gamma-glutamylcyclotransferase [Pseudodesulfovibrio cashew]|uniref:Gamma-glutamylcyclotransferase family protein n=1 Tax=Pseudodesulfovibrio cashew TaxID=2678688 RepID=A0A6I6JPK2_9BACT|nr:gamma-glutamylcyclotransferase family protein [Pseudodesulfovibrio cashew]QGY42037.1 gamma-glutamylcyclotransferase [Pseudodesulfovibrio cashew]
MARHAKQESEQLHTVFVYGTLKREFSNHYFLRNAKFVGSARTCERYSLYVDEFPLVFRGEPISQIRGEVYAVDDPTLTRLDSLEGHPREYRREEIDVQLQSGERVRAWMYFYPERNGRLISSGEYKLTTGLGREVL